MALREGWTSEDIPQLQPFQELAAQLDLVPVQPGRGPPTDDDTWLFLEKGTIYGQDELAFWVRGRTPGTTAALLDAFSREGGSPPQWPFVPPWSEPGMDHPHAPELFEISDGSPEASPKEWGRDGFQLIGASDDDVANGIQSVAGDGHGTNFVPMNQGLNFNVPSDFVATDDAGDAVEDKRWTAFMKHARNHTGDPLSWDNLSDQEKKQLREFYKDANQSIETHQYSTWSSVADFATQVLDEDASETVNGLLAGVVLGAGEALENRLERKLSDPDFRARWGIDVIEDRDYAPTSLREKGGRVKSIDLPGRYYWNVPMGAGTFKVQGSPGKGFMFRFTIDADTFFGSLFGQEGDPNSGYFQDGGSDDDGLHKFSSK